DMLQFLAQWEGKLVACSSRDLYRTLNSFGITEAERCLAEARQLRARSVEEQTLQLQEGRGRLLQRVMISGGKWDSCHGSIRQACQDGHYMVLVYSSMGLQNLKAKHLHRVPWCGMSIPRLDEIREEMMRHT
ncbi:unnamed protein product, partial [Symbiodinium pilosum]